MSQENCDSKGGSQCQGGPTSRVICHLIITPQHGEMRLTGTSLQQDTVGASSTCEGQVAQKLCALAHGLRLSDVVDVDHLGSQPAWQGGVRAMVRQQDAHVKRCQEQPLPI